jgi:choline dehydrogenase-like flavoprotein
MLYVRGNPGGTRLLLPRPHTHTTHTLTLIQLHKKDYDLWANEFGCTGWSYEEVLPYFRKSEHRFVFRVSCFRVGRNEKMTHVDPPIDCRVIEPWHTAATNDEKHRGAGGPLVVSDVQAPNTITRCVQGVT